MCGRKRWLQRHCSLALAPAVCFWVALCGCAATGSRPPKAAERPRVSTVHGVTRVDPYYWLRERDNPDVIAYLKAENSYAEAMMRPTRKLQEKLYQEMKARIKETDLEVPVRVDNFLYYTRTEAGKQYAIHCRRPVGAEGPEETLLDPNQLAQGRPYFRVGRFRVSPDHRLLAYSVDSTGGEDYAVYVKDLASGELLSDVIPDTYYSLEWGNDNRTLLYTVPDAAQRPHQVRRHVLGTDTATDAIVYEEKDEAYHLELSKTRSRRFLLLSADSQVTSEVRVLSADAPQGEFRVIEPRRHKIEYEVEHHGEHFYIVTNDEAVNFRLLRAPIERPGRANWEEVLPHRPEVYLEGVDAFAGHLAIYEREAGLRKLRIRPLDGGPDFYVHFPEPVYSYYPTGNMEFKTETLRFMYTSLVTPRSVFDYHMRKQTMELMKRDEVLGGYDPTQYVSERVFATAGDGAKVPVSLVYRRGLQRDGGNPALLEGYGAYGAPMDPRFSSEVLSLLDRGFVFAIAHVRGGGDLGRPWYEAGKLLNKTNTFTDFIACAEHLIREGYTSPERLAIEGGSAGGLLMGAVTNMRPDLFRSVIAKVPFVDVINTMLDASIPLTVIEYEEWGNPDELRFHDYMLRYSPYDNVTASAYPNLLVTAGLNDPRVQYWEPAKWMARLRAVKTDSNLLLLKTEMGAGHGGVSGRYDRLRETALDYAFLLHTLGITERN